MMDSRINLRDLTDHLQATNLQLQAVNGVTDTTCDGDGWSYRTHTLPLRIEAYPSMRESSCFEFYHAGCESPSL